MKNLLRLIPIILPLVLGVIFAVSAFQGCNRTETTVNAEPDKDTVESVESAPISTGKGSPMPSLPVEKKGETPVASDSPEPVTDMSQSKSVSPTPPVQESGDLLIQDGLWENETEIDTIG